MLPVAHGDVLRIGASRNVKPGYEAEANYEKSLVSHTKGAPPVKTSKTKETFGYSFTKYGYGTEKPCKPE